MKNQYFGDINDYKKYGLLRVLSNHGQLSTGVCWMLTENDARTDGNKITYLQQPERWKRFDPELFDVLHHSLHASKVRAVSMIERQSILPSTIFFSEFLTDEQREREVYFSKLHAKLSGADLLFFDPDNGIEVKSRRYGRKYSCKYIYWHEITRAFEAGHSLLLYQHFPRVNHRLYTSRMIDAIRSQLQRRAVFGLATSTVLYLLVPQDRHLGYFRERVNALGEKWGENFVLENFAINR